MTHTRRILTAILVPILALTCVVGEAQAAPQKAYRNAVDSAVWTKLSCGPSAPSTVIQNRVGTCSTGAGVLIYVSPLAAPASVDDTLEIDPCLSPTLPGRNDWYVKPASGTGYVKCWGVQP